MRPEEEAAWSLPSHQLLSSWATGNRIGCDNSLVVHSILRAPGNRAAGASLSPSELLDTLLL